MSEGLWKVCTLAFLCSLSAVLQRTIEGNYDLIEFGWKEVAASRVTSTSYTMNYGMSVCNKLFCVRYKRKLCNCGVPAER